MRGKLRKPVQQTAQWDVPTLEWVSEELRENTVKFLKFYGKQENYWSLDVSRAIVPNERNTHDSHTRSVSNYTHSMELSIV
jgi:hypothetical protein